MSKIGEQTKDIFDRANQRNKSKDSGDGHSKEEKRGPGRPKTRGNSSFKTMMTLKQEQVIWLDRLFLTIRSNNERILDRGQLIRAFIDALMESSLVLDDIESEHGFREVFLKQLNKK